MSLNELYEKLNLNNEHLHKKGSSTQIFSSRIRNIVDKLDYDSIYFVEDKPIFIFKEFESIEKNSEEIRRLHKEIWNLSEIPILFIKLDDEYILYNSYIFDKNKDLIWKEIPFDDEKSLDEFNYFNIVSDEFWQKYDKEFNVESKVDDYLLSNLELAKNKLVDLDVPFDIVNIILSRLILSRYLIDRDILKKNNFHKIYNKSFEDLISNKNELYMFFDFIKNKFDGDVFEVSKKELDIIQDKHLNLLSSLFKGNDLSSGQEVLFDVYDFSIIPIELISNIYETFLTGNPKQISDGIYYTPSFIVDYIIENTVSLKLENNNACKVLDPSCGSGVFLVESLRKLIETQDSLNTNILNSIVKNNIFGIDIDENAINISIFSIYITLLDYIEDYDDFHFPKLKNKNFFVSDFFDESSCINKLGDFDCIISNLPCINLKGDTKLFEKYCQNKNHQIAEAFIIRTKDFAKKEALVSLIVTSKIFYNISDLGFRKYLLENFYFTEFFDLTLVRDEIFKNTNLSNFIIFYQNKTEDIENHFVKHVSLKPNPYIKYLNRIVIESKDIKSVKQKYFLNYDWIFKLLLVGNSLDFEFIKRLNNDFMSLNEYMDNHSNIISGVGFKKGDGNSRINVNDFHGLPYLKSSDLDRYCAKASDLWHYRYIESGNINLMTPPFVLIKQNYSSKFDFISAFCNDNIVYDYNTFAIKGENEDIVLLRNIMATINSNLFKYYFFMTGNVGIDRNRSIFSERKNFPISKKLENNMELYELIEKREKCSDDELIREYESKIDDLIFDCYNLSDMERNLIDYALDITIPIITNNFDYLKEVTDDYLKKYVKVFFNSLESFFKPYCFEVNIYKTEFFIGMNFRVVNNTNIPINIHENNSDIDRILKIFGYTSFDELGDIIIKRDIKEVNDYSFSVIKTKSYSNWHESIAWNDVGEFIQLMFDKSR